MVSIDSHQNLEANKRAMEIYGETDYGQKDQPMQRPQGGLGFIMFKEQKGGQLHGAEPNQREQLEKL